MIGADRRSHRGLRSDGKPGLFPAIWLFTAALTVTLAYRWPLLGNPLVHVDEEFYQLVAKSWAHGALPYVDIWDRKPIGLFLLFRLVLLIPGDPVLAYQIVAAAATAVAALLIRRLALEIAPPAAAMCSALVYIFAMPIFSCSFGQTPVWYNPLIAGAALAVVNAWKATATRANVGYGAAAMALVGIALQIKYTVVFEGVALGLLMLVCCWRLDRGYTRLSLIAAMLVVIALAPTALALLAYVAIGHGHEFVQANFLSIFARSTDGSAAWMRLAGQCAVLIPWWLAAANGLIPAHGTPASTATTRRVLAIWALSAVGGYLVFGTWLDAYVAPLLPPLCVLAAPTLAFDRPVGRWFGALLLLVAAIGGQTAMLIQRNSHGDAEQLALATARIREGMHGGCLFTFDGPPRIYDSVGACIPTRFVFADHLNRPTEARAIGVDPVREVTRIMHSHPDVVMIAADARPEASTDARIVVGTALGQDYQRYADVMLGDQRFALYRRTSP
jgi:4-amino-4-deoxy-L-arabinose transferase-like glycosyltransferase